VSQKREGRRGGERRDLATSDVCSELFEDSSKRKVPDCCEWGNIHLLREVNELSCPGTGGIGSAAEGLLLSLGLWNVRTTSKHCIVSFLFHRGLRWCCNHRRGVLLLAKDNLEFFSENIDLGSINDPTLTLGSLKIQSIDFIEMTISIAAHEARAACAVGFKFMTPGSEIWGLRFQIFDDIMTVFALVSKWTDCSFLGLLTNSILRIHLTISWSLFPSCRCF
jgi:hypothetical protein